MNTLYLSIAAIMPLLVLFFLLIRKQNSMKKSIMMFLLVFTSVAGAFLLENLQAAHVAKAVHSVKHWLDAPEASSALTVKEDYQAEIIPIKDHVLLDAPTIWQMPELPRGCEVTSLAMLLQYNGLSVDKLTLAKEVKKNPAEYKLADGKIYFGDPHEGFVGNMYTYTQPGLGVYHEPIAELAEKYLPRKIEDLTGADFQELKIHLSDSRPVWVIINTEYKKLDESFFQTWYTPNGEVKVTTKEHSVLLTGYDNEFVYFNDPLTGEKNKKAPMHEFVEAWVQMGSQAITYLPN
ncbi:C39 family peptidase [Mesobacillus subterraneus]|uniref:C39 family peptidase n=1 Tax=Mesobacillus subterraneus TaxID=285983 RepID=UPI00203EA108|nr:C39 family peptidase [Mesobacillus subterraneus]MCM3665951.1 C39 family peptidase [Mesobacillus subterraneus]MCM3684834.1 C39 family peptidase [Mesobacillus subterraneus]